jgi:hypothetical protein
MPCADDLLVHHDCRFDVRPPRHLRRTHQGAKRCYYRIPDWQLHHGGDCVREVPEQRSEVSHRQRSWRLLLHRVQDVQHVHANGPGRLAADLFPVLQRFLRWRRYYVQGREPGMRAEDERCKHGICFSGVCGADGSLCGDCDCGIDRPLVLVSRRAKNTFFIIICLSQRDLLNCQAANTVGIAHVAPPLGFKLLKAAG